MRTTGLVTCLTALISLTPALLGATHKYTLVLLLLLLLLLYTNTTN